MYQNNFEIFNLGHTLPENHKPINWRICILCQSEENPDPLIDPARNTKGNAEERYSILAKNLRSFFDLDQLPFEFNWTELNGNDGIEKTMLVNGAMWHRNCYRKCSADRLAWAQKRSLPSCRNEIKAFPMKTRKLSTPLDQGKCLFCDTVGTKFNPLRQKSTNSQRIGDTAMFLKDTEIMSKLGGAEADLLALQIKYHAGCLASYYNRKRAVELADKPSYSTTEDSRVASLTLARIVSHMKEVRGRADPSAKIVFKLPDIHKMYVDQLQQLGVTADVHKTRLKERLLMMCPDLECCGGCGQTCLFSFRSDIDDVVRSSLNRNYDAEYGQLLNCAQSIREDIFDHPQYEWENASSKSQSSSVPTSLKTLVKAVLCGPSAMKEVEDDEDFDQLTLTVSQLISFHARQRFRKDKVTEKRRHIKARETPLPVYVAMKLYGDTRKRDLVDKFFNLGLCISYDRLRSILKNYADRTCAQFHAEGVVCPTSLSRNVFTTAAVDNIDHNPSSTTSKDSFHGTAISIMQHPTDKNEGFSRQFETKEIDGSCTWRKTLELPLNYTMIAPCYLNTKNITYPLKSIQLSEDKTVDPLNHEMAWLNKCLSEDTTTWAAHHASTSFNLKKATTKIDVMPLFREKASAAPMMQHSLRVVRECVQFLNPGQTPVLVGDQPLYAILKQLQYTKPAEFGDEKYFIMMGALHIELAALRVAGQWLEDSGWVESLVEAKVTTQGRAESMIKVSHVTRTRYAHEVTVAALYHLRRKAYETYMEDSIDEPEPISFDKWCSEKLGKVPQFQFWNIVLNIEVLILQFVRAIRSADFKLYISAARQLLPWFFALDHPNYARWLSVHVKDLMILDQSDSDLVQKFRSGFFVARKTARPFSAIALDQAHEQVNATLKGDGGMIGLTEDPTTFKKWMLSLPQIAMFVENFECMNHLNNEYNEEEERHHSDTKSAKQKFSSDVQSLLSTIENLGNPFLEEGPEIFNIYTKKVACEGVSQTVKTIENEGVLQYRTFVDERLQNGKKSVMEPIKKNKFPLFSSRQKLSRISSKEKALKTDCALFSSLYIACQTRQGDLNTFFSHENEHLPPALSNHGEMRGTVKSDLLKCLTKKFTTHVEENTPRVDCKIFDGAALMYILKPTLSSTFTEYAGKIIIPFLHRELLHITRIDVVWDCYKADSLKNITRDKRGSGVRTKVTAGTRIPKNWVDFLKNAENKEELFCFLASQISNMEIPDGKEIYTTHGNIVLCTHEREDLVTVSPCNHEEADTRMILHALDASKRGCQKIMIRTVDTDVVVLAVSVYKKIPLLEELWVSMGTGRNHHYLAAHGIAADLGEDRSKALPMFHALTGCDTTSSFAGKGKQSCFNAWEKCGSATAGFLSFAEKKEGNFAGVQSFVMALYDSSLPPRIKTVNGCRRYLFTKKRKSLEAIPPTEDALCQHIKRAALQGCHIWGRCLEASPTLPSPADWGWAFTEAGTWTPQWITIPTAAECCTELPKCSCKECGKRCSCAKKGLPCTELCHCDGECKKTAQESESDSCQSSDEDSDAILFE